MSVIDSVRLWLWNLSPVPQTLLLLAVSIGLAVWVRAAMLRNRRFTRTSANVMMPVVTVLLLLGLAGAWSLGVLAPTLAPLPFSRGDWLSKAWLRYRMAADVVERRILDDATPGEVESLLGPGDDSWWLLRPRDAFIVLSAPELVVHYGDDGRVERFYIADSRVP